MSEKSKTQSWPIRLGKRFFSRIAAFFLLHADLLKVLDEEKRSEYIRDLNQELEQSDGLIEPHYDIVERSLDSVSHLSEHEDDKASRRLTAMAFMGAVLVGFSAYAFSAIGSSDVPRFAKLGPWILLAYYLLCLIGGVISLYALLPRYNINSTKVEAPRSLIFAPEIDRVTGKNWVQPFLQNQKDQLRELVARQNLGEIKLISQVTVWKMKMHTLAGGYFVLALALFFTMVASFAFEKMSASNPKPSILVFDADNTLWDTDALYRNAQLELLAAVEDLSGQKASGDRLAYLRGFDQQIAKSDPAGFRYPPQLLAERLYHELRAEKAPIPETANQAVIEKLRAAVAIYLQRLNDKPTLFPQAKETLELCAKRHAKLILLSESSLQRVQHLLLAYDLTGYFHQVISNRNKKETFATIKESIDPRLRANCVFVSIGDQVTYDLMPAKSEGYRTVLIPAGFKMIQENVNEFVPDFTFLTLSELGAKLDDVLVSKN